MLKTEQDSQCVYFGIASGRLPAVESVLSYRHIYLDAIRACKLTESGATICFLMLHQQTFCCVMTLDDATDTNMCIGRRSLPQDDTMAHTEFAVTNFEIISHRAACRAL